MFVADNSPVKRKQFRQDKISSCMFNKESQGHWQSLLPLPASSAGESEGGSASRVVVRQLLIIVRAVMVKLMSR